MRGRNISGWSVKYSHKAEVAVLGAPAIKNIDGLFIKNLPYLSNSFTKLRNSVHEKSAAVTRS